VGYRFHDGWGGTLNGVILHGYRAIGERLTLDASVDFTDYQYGRVDDADIVQDEDNRATSGLLAIGYLVHPKLRLTAQVEGLSTKTYEDEVRFLGMIDWRFRAGL